MRLDEDDDQAEAVNEAEDKIDDQDEAVMRLRIRSITKLRLS
jgi:hypothetical protein